VRNFLYAYFNTIIKKLPSNLITKSLESYQRIPVFFQKRFLNKIFENKQNWLETILFSNQSFLKNTNKNIFVKNFKNYFPRLIFALNWSTGKRYF
jgi:hypothetical protein